MDKLEKENVAKGIQIITLKELDGVTIEFVKVRNKMNVQDGNETRVFLYFVQETDDLNFIRIMSRDNIKGGIWGEFKHADNVSFFINLYLQIQNHTPV